MVGEGVGRCAYQCVAVVECQLAVVRIGDDEPVGLSADGHFHPREDEVGGEVGHLLHVLCRISRELAEVHRVLRLLAVQLDAVGPDAVDDELEVALLAPVLTVLRRGIDVEEGVVGVERQHGTAVILHAVERLHLAVVGVVFIAHDGVVACEADGVGHSAVTLVALRVVVQCPSVGSLHKRVLRLLEELRHALRVRLVEDVLLVLQARLQADCRQSEQEGDEYFTCFHK